MATTFNRLQAQVDTVGWGLCWSPEHMRTRIAWDSEVNASQFSRLKSCHYSTAAPQKLALQKVYI
jgi:hypothetical protein